MQKPLPEDELEQAKNYVALGYPVGLRDVRRPCSRLARVVRLRSADGLPLDVRAEDLKVTVADVGAAARSRHHPDRFVVVIVGDRAKIEAPLRALNLGPIRVLSADQAMGESRAPTLRSWPVTRSRRAGPTPRPPRAQLNRVRVWPVGRLPSRPPASSRRATNENRPSITMENGRCLPGHDSPLPSPLALRRSWSRASWPWPRRPSPRPRSPAARTCSPADIVTILDAPRLRRLRSARLATWWHSWTGRTCRRSPSSRNR